MFRCNMKICGARVKKRSNVCIFPSFFSTILTFLFRNDTLTFKRQNAFN